MTARQPSDREIATAMNAAARQDFGLFVEVMHLALTGDAFELRPFHARLFEVLSKVYLGEIARLILALPPRSGKTSILQMFHAWTLGRHPDSATIIASYGADLAEGISSGLKRIVEHERYRAIFPGVSISRDTSARDRWATVQGGEFRAVGTGGAIVGFGAGRLRTTREYGGCIVYDDPIKVAEARSEAARAAAFDFFIGSLRTRRNSPKTPIIIAAQRCHEDDLIGRLKAGATGEQWHELTIPALDENDASFWEHRFPAAELVALREAQPWTFYTQMQGEPYSSKGAIFNVDAAPIIDGIPTGSARRIRAWDLAATEAKPGRDPDWTVGLRLAKFDDGRVVIEDVVRLRGRPDEVRAAIRATAERDGRAVRISIPQDPGQAGKSQAQSFVAMLGGYTVTASTESGDKLTRAEPAAAQLNVGNILILRANWTDSLIDELRAFDSGRHDDQVDALSRAFNELCKPQPWAGLFDYIKANPPQPADGATRISRQLGI